MSRIPFDDETLANPLDLLARYRRLCEARGAAQAIGARLTPEEWEQLARLEAELQTRLWMASAVPSTAGRRETPRQREAGGTHEDRDGTGPRSGQIFSADPGTGAATGRAEDEAASPSNAGVAMVFCDGACIGNPGPGGYGALVRVPGHPERTLSAGRAKTTNNQMELTAAVEGLKLAASLGAKEVTVVSDSEYLVKGMKSWLRAWLRNGWKTKGGEPVKNRDLWEQLSELCRDRAVTWTWTRGHNGQPENERCDALAEAAAREAARGGRR